MRQEKKKFAEFKRNISYILIMILCIASLSCGVSAAEYDPPASLLREYIQSAEYARTDDINYGEITKKKDGTQYNLYIFGGYLSSDYFFGYYSVKLHILTKLNSNEDIRVTAFKIDHLYDEQCVVWKYSGKIIKDMEFNIGSEAGERIYFEISGPENMKYKFNVKFHKAKNWEYSINNRISQANPFDVNNTIHGNTCKDEYCADFDYFIMEIPSQGIITFEMDRTPKNNHTIMIYDSNKKQIWKTKATTESHISSKKLKSNLKRFI